VLAACLDLVALRSSPTRRSSDLARRRRTRLRDVWPDVVDHVSSAVRAGLALPEALVQLGERGPAELRPAFLEFAHDYRATGRFSDRKSTRLNSSHVKISYAVFCL